MPVAPMIPEGNGASAPPSPGTPAAAGQGLTIETQVERTTLYRGAQLLGTLPMFVDLTQLGEEPLVLLAHGHHPAVLDPHQIRERVSRGRARMLVPLLPSMRPERAVYVSHPRAAQVRVLGRGDTLGAVPGLVLVPPTPMGGWPNLEVVEGSSVVGRFETATCPSDAVCARP